MRPVTFEIGQPRSDGKRNVWAWGKPRGGAPEWFVYDVAPTFQEAMILIEKARKRR